MISGHGLEVGGAVFFQNRPQRVARIAKNEKAPAEHVIVLQCTTRLIPQRVW
jgi:hypothetical protein